jgi:hypothetical protein
MSRGLRNGGLLYIGRDLGKQRSFRELVPRALQAAAGVSSVVPASSPATVWDFAGGRRALLQARSVRRAAGAAHPATGSDFQLRASQPPLQALMSTKRHQVNFIWRTRNVSRSTLSGIRAVLEFAHSAIRGEY